MATNQADTFIGKMVALAGKENFFDVANTFTDGKAHMQLDPQNFLSMAQAVNARHKTLVIASHNPHYPGYGSRVLPDTPGLAAVIVANLTDRVVLPVAMDFQAEGSVGMANNLLEGARSRVKGGTSVIVHIAEPIVLDKGGIPDEMVTTKDEVLQALELLRSETRQKMEKYKRSGAITTFQKLQKQAEIVLLAQAAELPSRSRGIWEERLRAGNKNGS